MATRAPRAGTPERWQTALQRAIAGNVQVRQLSATGQWIATSATDAGAAYELSVTGDVAHGCTCHAGEFGDPVCCHRAMFWHLAGVLDLAEPAEPAQAPAPVVTTHCRTCGRRTTGATYCCDACWEYRPSGGPNAPIQIVSIAA